MSKTNTQILIIEKLRAFLRSKKYDMCIIPQNDPHLSEYVSDYYKVREYFSGFDGSAGTLVVGLDSAALWTDGRYFLQAEAQLEGSGIELYRIGVDGVPKMEDFLAERVGKNGIVIANSNVISASKWEEMQERINLYHSDEWEIFWGNRPLIKKSKIWYLDWAENEVSYNEKINRVREKMSAEEADFYLVSSLDEFSWLFNLRADDIEYTPVVRGFAIIGMSDVRIFIDSEEYFELEGVQIYNYNEIGQVLSTLKGKIWLDKGRVNALLYNVCRESLDIFASSSPITVMKAVKSESEKEGFRRANIYDGVVWVRLMKHIDESLKAGRNITELSVAEKIRGLKASNKYFVTESFESIVGYASNAAIVHYSATEETNREILPESFLLIDSGTHYNIGTTDTTRTLVCGQLSDEQKRRFTQVLKGMIAVATAEFKVGTTGADLDVLAREFLKEEKLDYLHGTGHGIGSVMCVHEDGVGISPRFIKPIQTGMVCTDEPGFYKEGEYGIRIENMLLCKQVSEEKLAFETLTLVPIDLQAIEVKLLTEKEKEWINNFHRNIKVSLREYLSDDEFLWLDKKYYEI